MIAWLVRHALQLRVVVLCATAVMLIQGVRSARQAPLDVFPEFAPPLVEIQTEAPGLSTPEVEALVSVPLENALNGISWLTTLRSRSVLGLSSVVLIFQPGTDLMRARQLVAERIATVGPQLPSVARPPVILSPLSATSRVMKIGITSKVLDQVGMTTLARWTIRPRLMAITGVANVAIWGQRDRQLQVLVDPERLAAHELTLDQVLAAARDATPPAAGGFVDTPNQRLAVTHAPSVTSAADLARIPVGGAASGGPPLRLGDVAQVVEGHQPVIGDAIINDVPGLLLIVEKQPWGNTLEVTEKVEAALAAMRPGLKQLEIDSTIFRPASYIERSIGNLERALLLGCGLVVVILIVFLWDWRTALISVLSIPLSLLAAVLVLDGMGQSLNTMVLAGLVIALGEVVDDAIIDVENIVRRLRENTRAEHRRSSFAVVLSASLEVRSAVVHATFIVALVFAPVFLLDGLAGSFFRPLALSYLLAVGASLLVALTVTPALALMFLPGRVGAGGGAHRSPLLPHLHRWYARWLRWFVQRPGKALAVGAVSVGLALVTLPLLGEEFLPSFKELDFLMHWVEKPGTSIEAMDRITVAASKELRAIPGVRNFGSHIGRAEVADEVVGPNFTELWISLDPDVDYDATVARVQEVVDGYPGLYRDLLTYLKERIKEVLTGAGASIVVRLYGPDLETLRTEATKVGKSIADLAGVVDLKVEPQVLVPQIEIAPRPEAAARLGLTPGHLRRAAATMVKGTKVGEIYEEQKIFDVVVWGLPQLRRDVASLRSLRIDTPSGAQVPLGDVAEVRIVSAPNVIQREGASRRIDITCNVRGRDLGQVAREIEGRVRALAFPTGYHPEVLGEYVARQQASRRLAFWSVLALLGIFLILHSDFGSARLAGIAFASLPFALVGGVLAVLLTGGVLSLGSLVGFVTVIGIAARNGIMLMSHFRHLEREEGMTLGPALVLRGAHERLAPILMTALATALALLPIAISGVRPGHEIEHPLAVVILGGLLSSTFLNLFLLPAIYLRFGRPLAPAESEAT